MRRNHEYFMNIAMKLALKARGDTLPNPMVGALVVKNGKIVGEGFHKKAGLPHAEIIALEKAGQKSKKATLYVTLEPCTHFGKTPPCVDRIIKSGIKEVIVGMVDPNPINNGRGISILKQNNIKVKAGYLKEQLSKINRAYVKYITKRMPFITVKVAQSLDGRIATRSGDSKWITSDKALSFSRRLRRNFDAVMVGVNTVLRDNPKLDAWFSRKQPAKVIVDSELSTPIDSNIFSKNAKVIIVTLASGPGQETENKELLSGKAKILETKEKGGQINLKDMLKRLVKQNIFNCLVEGGGTLIGSLFDEGLVDKVLFFVSPKIIGGKDAIGSVMGKGVARINKVTRLKEIKLKRIGEDFLLEGYVK